MITTTDLIVSAIVLLAVLFMVEMMFGRKTAIAVSQVFHVVGSVLLIAAFV